MENRFKDYMENARHNYSTLGKILDVSPTTVSNWDKRVTAIPSTKIKQLAKELNITVNKLLERE